MTTLEQAARAVLERWDSPAWKWGDPPTADLMHALRAALAAGQAQPVAPAESLEDLRKMLQDEVERLIAALPAQPLTDEQIEMIGSRALDKCFGTSAQHVYIAREVERAHGIT